MTRPQEDMADVGREKKITVENKFKELRGQDVRRINQEDLELIRGIRARI